MLCCLATPNLANPDDASLQIVFEFPRRVSQPTLEGIKTGKVLK